MMKRPSTLSQILFLKIPVTKYSDKFDASAFHEAILRTGPAPFSIVEEQVKRALR